MKLRVLLLGVLLAVASTSCVKEKSSEVQHEAAPSELLAQKLMGCATIEHKRGSMLLYLDEATTTRALGGDMDDVVATLFNGVEIIAMEPILTHKPKNEKLAHELGLHRWFSVTFSSEMDVDDVMKHAVVHPEVCGVQYCAGVKPASNCIATPYTPNASMTRSEDAAFDDVYYTSQWNLENRGDKSIAKTAREGADVSVRDAWRLTAGTPDVIVAVIDAPVMYTHPDLKDAMWTNNAEFNGTEGVDDDDNGYVDDIYGYNFYHEGWSNGMINWEIEGESGHGTHVAGIVGAVNNNGIGVSSVAGGSGKGDGVRIMSCQIFEGGLSTDNAGISRAFIYAADNGACIAQCSYGYDARTYAHDNAYINDAPVEYRAIKYFTDPENCNHPSLGANLAIFAAGNEYASNSDYPGALPLCVSVTSFGPDFLPGWYTNYGRGCNIAAPGGDNLKNANGEMAYAEILSTCIPDVVSEYAYMSGTSMACPHVSGVAALGISYAGKLGKKYMGNEFRDMLLTSVTDINSYLNGSKEYGYNNIPTLDLSKYYKRMGTGAVDAWRLLMQIEGTPSVMVTTGVQTVVDLREYFGASAADLTYLDITVSDEAKEILGINSTPKMKDGMLAIKCNKRGAAKITVSAIAGGGQLGGGNNMGGTEICREVSIISRGVSSTNGGWF